MEVSNPLKMYGLYLEAVNDYINESYGEDVWRLIENRAEIPHLKFVRHQMYNDNLILRLAKAAGEVLGKTHDELMYAFGVYMVKRIGNYGYERILKVLGRNVRDFINELDNLHEYFRFSFPKVQPPSFCVEEECETSLTLHYRSTRKGFTQFVKGQLSQVGRQFYSTDIEVEILSKEETEKMTYVVYKMNFDNAAFKHRTPQQKTAPGYEKLPMKRGLFFDMFPFSVIFRRDMTMYRIGDGLKEVFSDLQGKKIYTHLNNVFELLSVAVVESKQKVNIPKLSKEDPEEGREKEENGKQREKKKEDMEEMKGSDQEYSGTVTHRELILAGTQQSAELQLALDQEQQKYAQLMEVIKTLDEEKKRGDSLLYAMIPKAVADRLRKGITALETCQVFPDVTILFSDVVKFNEICIHITPMQVVDMLNEIYIVFDTLSEKHNVYKMPRYCLFGDTVNTASRMESNGVGMQIHISQTTKDHLEHEPYIIEERGKIFVKGKGYMKTYWLKGKRDLSFKTPAELRYSAEQKDSEDKSSNGSISSNTKRMGSNLNIGGSREHVEGKPSPCDLPLEHAPPPEVEPAAISDEPHDKEKANKKTKNNKGAKMEGPPVIAVIESLPPEETIAPLINSKRNSFRQQYAKLPTAKLPMRSASCCLL
ncbi:hypothetical protein F7725_017910 [Dissostichus mawsoni]|uniref:guanylate cyclase n=1 Tax=Dissostichus mawsoni TaxID=36200 RepID=A0A7J5XQS6_DISMA|nr:hypothetical protein F7725_017910 [Dissostichus mawsoni]